MRTGAADHHPARSSRRCPGVYGSGGDGFCARLQRSGGTSLLAATGTCCGLSERCRLGLLDFQCGHHSRPSDRRRALCVAWDSGGRLPYGSRGAGSQRSPDAGHPHPGGATDEPGARLEYRAGGLPVRLAQQVDPRHDHLGSVRSSIGRRRCLASGVCSRAFTRRTTRPRAAACLPGTRSRVDGYRDCLHSFAAAGWGEDAVLRCQLSEQRRWSSAYPEIYICRCLRCSW